MPARDAPPVWKGFWANSLGTLASRVLGLVRDIATAGLLGMGEGSVMDALVLAFRLPNLLRRLFGEGALAASFLPVFSAELEQEPRRAWQLLSALFVWLAAGLTLLVLIGELVCGWMLWQGASPGNVPLLTLTAWLLPYVVLICLAAQAGVALQALLEFRWPALAPTLLNLCWLGAVWWVAPRYSDKLLQAQVIAASVLISGVLQFVVLLPTLRRRGFRFDWNWQASRSACERVVASMVPITLGLAVTQLNTLMDSVIAWTLARSPDMPLTIAWLGDRVAYPLTTGAVAAIYYGERFYQLPVGVLGIAVATVIYPLLSRHAARGDWPNIARDLTVGLRLVVFLGVPASAGMMLVALPATQVLFQHGEFTADDAARAARMIACYASGVWAYCAIPVLVRGYYAIGDRLSPARLGTWAAAVNLALNLTLVWPLAEAGLAISTATAAALQVLLLARHFARTGHALHGPDLVRTIIKTLLATGAMSLALLAWNQWGPWNTPSTRVEQAVHLAVGVIASVTVYWATAWGLRMSEIDLLLRRQRSASSV